MDRILSSQEPMALTNYMETYFKHKTPDISLFSQDNFEIPVHKEVFYQTQLMCSMLKSANFDNCCSKASVICPLQNEELRMIVQFLYNGELVCRNEEEATQMSKNLSELFGFPPINLMLKLEHKIEITSTPIENELQFKLTESCGIKKSSKQVLTTASVENKFINENFVIKNETKENEADFNDEDITDPLAFEMKQEDTESEVDCAICNKIFKNKKVRAKHLFQKHREACTICFRQFESKQDMAAHISKDHPWPAFRNVAMRCVICDLSYRKDKENMKKFKDHMISEHNVGYECPICQKKLPTMSKMKQHRVQEHNWTEYKRTRYKYVSKIKYLCPKCGKEYNQRLEYERHVSLMSCKAWRGKVCSICDERFETMSLRNDHITTKHKEVNLYDCSECSSQFLTENNLKSHISNSHKPKVGSICSICGKILTTATALKKHISQVHEGNKPRFKCTLCDGSFSTKQALENHMSVHEGKIFQCSNCNEDFNSKNKLEVHIAKEHDRSKLHKCEHCDSAYVTKNALVTHIAFVHDKTISNICPHCGKNCMSKAQLKTHVRQVHELAGKKPYKCRDCKKDFRSEGVMKEHIKIHHEGKTVNCPVCQNPFQNKAALKRHIDAVHEKKRPHACDICNESFAQKPHLKTHKKGKHKIIM